MKTYIEQIRICEKKGNCIECDISVHEARIKEISICIKHKCACHSAVCYEDRLEV